MWKSDKLESLFSKKRNIFLLYGIVSICILLLAFGRCSPEKTDAPTKDTPSPTPSLQETLSAVLGEIRGVGQVKVAVTFESGTETVPARDRDKDRQTVVTLGSGSNERIVAEKEIMPRVRGVVVVCTGGENARVRADVSSAVQSLTGADAHSIAVFPAK